MSTLSFTFKINGALVDATSVTLNDAASSYGVRRVDNLDIVVAAGTVVPRTSLGKYAYTFTDPEPNLTYEYNLEVVYAGTTYRFNRTTSVGEISNLISIPTADHYSSSAEVYRVSGEYAIELMMEDYLSEDKGYIWEQFLQSADDTIAMYVGQHYDPTTLYSNKWIRARATWLVSNLLSQRRGNHQLFVSQIQRVYEELNMIRDGRFHIPNAAPRHWQGPMWRNYLVQTRDVSHPIKVDTTKSNKQEYSGMDIAWQPFWYTFNG